MAITALRPSRTAAHEGALLTLEQAAAYLQIAPGTLKHWIAWQRIEHIKLGKLTRFRKGALDRFIAAQTVAAVTEE